MASDTLFNTIRRATSTSTFWILETLLKVLNLQTDYRNYLLHQVRQIKGLEVIVNEGAKAVEKKSSPWRYDSSKFQNGMPESTQIIVRINNERFWRRLAMEGEIACLKLFESSSRA